MYLLFRVKESTAFYLNIATTCDNINFYYDILLPLNLSQVLLLLPSLLYLQHFQLLRCDQAYS